jgi:hypothetical protein
MTRHPQLIGLFVLVSGGLLLPMAACTDAGGKASGGELTFEAGTPVVTQEAGPGQGTGTAFSDLYRDFFGPKGAAKCSGNGSCHGGPTQPGALASGGYVCPDSQATADAGSGGDDASAGDAASGDAAAADPGRAQCRDTMMKHIIVDGPGGTTSTCGQPFAKSWMFTVIRKATHAADDENSMPKMPYTYTFSDESVARINTWVQAGCPDN